MTAALLLSCDAHCAGPLTYITKGTNMLPRQRDEKKTFFLEQLLHLNKATAFLRFPPQKIRVRVTASWHSDRRNYSLDEWDGGKKTLTASFTSTQEEIVKKSVTYLRKISYRQKNCPFLVLLTRHNGAGRKTLTYNELMSQCVAMLFLSSLRFKKTGMKNGPLCF